MRLTWIILIISMAACASEPDPRFESPQATVQTLLGSYGLAHATPIQRQEWLRSERHELLDSASFRASFSDYSSFYDEGLGGFIVGALARHSGEYRFENVSADRARLVIDENRVVHFVRTKAGWKIVLLESVPREIQAQLRQVTRRAYEANVRNGRVTL